jgi:formylglycine-generating enzyme required for sulfatase activity
MLLYAADNPPRPARRALIIGNGAYQFLPPASASSANADLIAQVLSEVGFKPEVRRDLTQADMRSAIEQFMATLQPGDFVFVYFSGYGLQDGDVNYLLPVSYNAKDTLPPSQKSYSVSRLLTMLEGRKAGTRMVILDASRPSTDLPEGLYPLTPANRTLIASSTMPNQTAADPPTGIPNVFAKALAEAIKAPGSSPQRVLASTQAEVSKVTDYKQSPFFVPAPVEPFYFVDPLPEKVIEVPKPVETGDRRENPKDGLNYVWIPAGSFKMGCVSGDKACQKEELPQHDVKITHGFWMTSTEVTFLAYQKFAERTGHSPPQKTKVNDNGRRTDVPVTDIGWSDAADYCKWADGRLPTEAEWEYAARGGKPNQKYPWGDEFDATAANSFKSQSERKKFYELVPVTYFGSANGYNLYDMAGNAAEWVADFYDLAYYKPGPVEDPQGPAAGTERVIRGGSFNDSEKNIRISSRYHRPPAKPENTTGFRCVVMSLK